MFRVYVGTASITCCYKESKIKLYTLIGVEVLKNNHSYFCNTILYEEGYASCRNDNVYYGIRMPDEIISVAKNTASTKMKEILKAGNKDGR